MDYTALIAGLVGALIGAFSSLLGQLVQNRYQGQRESRRLLYETAYKDYELRVLHRNDNIAPFPVILDYHARLMGLINEGKLTPETATAVMRAQGIMNAAVLEASRQPD